jgi:hypothetical protein
LFVCLLCVSSPCVTFHIIRKNNNKGTFNKLINEVESTTMVPPVRRTRGMARMERRNDVDVDDDVEEVPVVVTHETLTAPAVSVSNVVSKTSEFKWKLTKLPVNPHAVEVIKFETEVVGDGVTVLYPFEF